MNEVLTFLLLRIRQELLIDDGAHIDDLRRCVQVVSFHHLVVCCELVQVHIIQGFRKSTPVHPVIQQW